MATLLPVSCASEGLMGVPTRTIAIPLCGLLLAVTACASAGARSSDRTSSCALRSSDSAFARVGPVYRDCAVDRAARLLNSRIVHPDFRPTRATCYSAEVEFVVGVGGSAETQTVRIVKATDGSFAQSVVAMVPRLEYEPAQRGGVPVRQIVTLKEGMSLVMVCSSPPAQRSRAPRC